MDSAVTVLSPPCASLSLSASSTAYSSSSLITASTDARSRVLSLGSSRFSAQVSGTCLTHTTMFTTSPPCRPYDPARRLPGGSEAGPCRRPPLRNGTGHHVREDRDVEQHEGDEDNDAN